MTTTDEPYSNPERDSTVDHDLRLLADDVLAGVGALAQLQADAISLERFDAEASHRCDVLLAVVERVEREIDRRRAQRTAA